MCVCVCVCVSVCVCVNIYVFSIKILGIIIFVPYFVRTLFILSDSMHPAMCTCLV